MNKAILEGIGLTKSEISVYLALLELGSSSTGKIVDKSGASSSKIYEILDRLIQKGLVSYVLKANVKYFEAAPPKRILDYIEEKKASISQQETEVKKLLPELELKRSLAGIGSETQVFKGMKGAKTAFDDILNTLKRNEKYYLFAHSEVKPEFQMFLNQIHSKRAKAGIKCDIIVNELARKDWEIVAKLKGTRIKYVQKELFTPFAFIIYKDKVLISIASDQVFIQVKSEKLADGLRSYFDFLWSQKTNTYVGRESLRNLFTEMLEFGDYVVYAEVTRIMDILGADFFLWWQNEKKKRGITSRGIMGEKHRLHKATKSSLTNFKFIPGFENPSGDLFVFKDKVVNVVYTTKEPIAFLIDNKEVADNNRAHFETLWNQDVRVYKGFEAVTNRFRQNMEELEEGDEYYVLGSALYFQEESELKDFFIDYHRDRIKRKIIVKLLAIPESYDIIHKEITSPGDPEMKYAALKRLPPEFKYPMQITLYKGNKVSLISWTEFLCFEIESKTMYDNFKANFDMLWGQEAEVFKGKGGVKALLNILLESPGKEHHTFGSTRESLMLGEDWWINYHKKRADKGIHAKLLFNESLAKWKAELKYPDSEVHYTKAGFEPLTETIIRGEKAAIIIWTEEPTGFLINNKAVADSYDKFFNMLWEQIK
ncbi:helix-turn-helix domain-containing protein [Candidatus Woesearchaeota archaeon]|nr:helix-turn-helix domain-containing protein [Candidatus Woesearchaeota archaeon]